MAELLLCVQDKAGFDPKANALTHRPGDVIVVCPDGWGWTPAELNNPDWRLLKMPGLDPSAVRALQDCAIDAKGKVLAKRAQNLDITNPALSSLIGVKGVPVVVQAALQPTILALQVVKNVSAITVG